MAKKTVKEKVFKTPKWLWAFVGKKVSIINLVLYVAFAVLVTAAIIIYDWTNFATLWWGSAVFYVLLSLFNNFSVVTNITVETSKIYEPYRKNKLIYIFANVFPLVLLLISRGIWYQYVGIWAYVVIVSVFIAFLKGRPLQKTVGFAAVALAMLLFAACFQNIPVLFSLQLIVHIVNVVFCVAVSQYLDEKF